MGKRSRARSGAAKSVRAAPKSTGQSESASVAPDSPVERAKVSWRVAADAGPSMAKQPGQKPRAKLPSSSGSRGRRDRGERPAALWGRAPISEFAVLAGIIVLAVGLSRGPDSPAITGGLIMISIAALEFAAREHVRGYRSHSLFLAMILVIIVHLAVAFIIGAKTARSPIFFAVDVALFVALASALHKQYAIARLDTTPKRSR